MNIEYPHRYTTWGLQYIFLYQALESYNLFINTFFWMNHNDTFLQPAFGATGLIVTQASFYTTTIDQVPQSRTRLVLKEYSETDTKSQNQFHKSLTTGARIEAQGKASDICASCRNAGHTGDSGRNSWMKPFLHGRRQPKRSHSD